MRHVSVAWGDMGAIQGRYGGDTGEISCDAPRLGRPGRFRGDIGPTPSAARSPLYLPYISPVSPLYLPYISPISPLHLPYISAASSHSERRSIFESWLGVG